MTLGLTFVLAVMTGGIYVASFGPDSGVPVLIRGGQGVNPIASPDTFDWQVQRTDHFEIHYYAALQPQLEQVANSAERAYQSISSDLQYNLSVKVPLILFKTRSDFEQQAIVPEAREAIAQGWVTSFSEPKGNRVVILTEEEPERLYRQITHELSHIFAFDLIPRSSTSAGRVPSWIDEGFAEHMTGVWDAENLTQIRDLVVAERLPKMTALTGRADGQTARFAATLGHAVFDFIEAEYGKPAVWQFLLEVRRNVVDGTGNLYQAAFNRTPQEFDSAFARYVRKRFSP